MPQPPERRKVPNKQPKSLLDRQFDEVPEDIGGVLITDQSPHRQSERFRQAFGVVPAVVGLNDTAPELQAGGEIVALLDVARVPHSFTLRPLVVVVDIEPSPVKGRDSSQADVFCHFTAGAGHNIFAPYDARILGLVKKAGVLRRGGINTFTIPEVAQALTEQEILTEEESAVITATPQAGREFLPMIARITNGHTPPASQSRVAPERPEPYDLEGLAWDIGRTGKVTTTTIAPESLDTGMVFQLTSGDEAQYFDSARQVPANTLAVIAGSGYRPNQWLQVILPGGNAAEALQLRPGDKVFA